MNTTMTTSMTTTTTSVAETLAAFIRHEFMYDKPGLALTEDLALIEQGVVDSMGLFRLITFLDEQFNVIIAPDEILLENFGTVKAMAAFVTAKLTG